MEHFYRKTQFILLTCIATFLLILCFEIGHLDKVLAQSAQKVAICDVQGNNCASINRLSADGNSRGLAVDTFPR